MVGSIRAVEARSPFGMVSTSSVEATDAAVAVLESGGNAVDAAVAAAFTLGSAEPGSAGLGGTACVLIRFADGREIAVDGSAVVPLRIDRERLAGLQRRFRGADEDATSGYEFAAVPAALASLAYCAERYGTRTLADLLAPAIAVAETGAAAAEPTLWQMRKYLGVIRSSESLRSVVLVGGERPPEVGQRMGNAALARTLRQLAARGAADFYHGEIAARIEREMIRNGGFIRRSDLALVKARETEPLRGTYRGVTIAAFPPPGGGGIVIEALNILERFPGESLAGVGPECVRTIAEALHVAYEDNLTLRDDRAIDERGGAPRYLTKEFAAQRADLVRLGHPLGPEDLPRSGTFGAPAGGTTHAAVADRFGTVVSLTQSIGRFFGAKVLTPELGFSYNSLLEGCDVESPRRAPPLSRIATYMTPVILAGGGRSAVALGGAGSGKIPSAVVVTISDVIDRGMTLGDAVSAPRVLWSLRPDLSGELYLEVMPPLGGEVVERLKLLGYGNIRALEYPAPLRLVVAGGTVNVVGFDPATGDFVGVADPRRGGLARGPGR
jgi:gamma-glutamyltranspeptidase / glutathione hydrolase